jgi:hypothetical protein
MQFGMGKMECRLKCIRKIFIGRSASATIPYREHPSWYHDPKGLTVEFGANTSKIGIITKRNPTLEMATSITPIISNNVKYTTPAHRQSTIVITH